MTEPNHHGRRPFRDSFGDDPENEDQRSGWGLVVLLLLALFGFGLLIVC